MSFVSERLAAQTVGVNDVYEHNELLFDSNSRDGGTNNNPSFVLGPIMSNILGIKLLSAQIPFSYYVFNSLNNTFTLTSTGGTFTFVIPVGNYTGTTLASTLQTELNTIDPAGAYTVSYSAFTGKFTIVATNVAYTFSFTFVDPPPPSTEGPGATNPRLWLGFPNGTTSATGTPATLVAPLVANVTGPNYLLLLGSVASRISRSIRVNGFSSEDPAVIAKIPVNVNPGGTILYDDPTEAYLFDMSDSYLQEMDFSLEFGDSDIAVDLNGQPWSLVVHVITRRDTSVSRLESLDSGGGRRRLTGNSKRVRVG